MNASAIDEAGRTSGLVGQGDFKVCRFVTFELKARNSLKISVDFQGTKNKPRSPLVAQLPRLRFAMGPTWCKMWGDCHFGLPTPVGHYILASLQLEIGGLVASHLLSKLQIPNQLSEAKHIQSAVWGATRLESFQNIKTNLREVQKPQRLTTIQPAAA